MLLVRVRPHKNESFQTYCIKLAQSNGYKFSAFCTQIGHEASPYKSTKTEDRKCIAQLVAEISGYEEVKDIVDFQACYHTHKLFIDYTRVKICPCCIGSGDLPLYWSLKNYLVCVEHQTQLIDVCSSCSLKLTAESLSQNCCIECLTPLSVMLSEKAAIDKYSRLCYEKFSNFIGDTKSFTRQIDSYLRPLLEELIILDHIYDKLHKLDIEQEKKRRLFLLNELHKKQLACDEISQDLNAIKSILLRYVLLQISVGYVNLGTALIEVISLFKYQGTKRIKGAVESILFQPPQQIENLAVGVNWLEKFLDLSSKQFVEFVKHSCSDSILKTQGSPTIYLKDVNKLVQRFETRLI